MYNYAVSARWKSNILKSYPNNHKDHSPQKIIYLNLWVSIVAIYRNDGKMTIRKCNFK